MIAIICINYLPKSSTTKGHKVEYSKVRVPPMTGLGTPSTISPGDNKHGRGSSLVDRLLSDVRAVKATLHVHVSTY